jgi:hypothetical protein
MMSYGMKLITLGLSLGLGALLAPACVIQIGPGGSGDSTGKDQGATTNAGAGGGSATSGGSGGRGGGADAFAGIDPEALDKATLKASALSYNMFGLVNSSGLDPSSVDQATLEALVPQLAPTAEATVNTWLSTIDSSTIQTAGNQPNWECTDKIKCPYVAKCSNAPYSGIPHLCWVNNCGSAKCTTCPSWFPDDLKTLTIGAWCAYICMDKSSPQKIVAVGAGGVTIFGGPYPEDGPFCFAP